MSLILRLSKCLLFRRGTLLSHVRCSNYSSHALSKLKRDPSCFDRPGIARCLKTRCLSFSKAEEDDFNLSSSPPPVRDSQTDLQKELYKLDYDARHNGRLPQAEVEKLFTAMKETGNIDSFDGLFLIRCCGSFIPEMLADLRTKLVQDIWATLPKLNCHYDVNHYNALLKVYLENEHKFDPVEFMKSMEQQGIEPNRVTYKHLVSSYCQHGEVEGAKNILEFLKSKNLPINEHIFNDLIFGYAKAKNMEGANDILEAMKNAQLPPSSATYIALSCGYAVMGDIENVLASLNEMEKNGAFLQDKDVLKIVYTLTVNQNGHLVEQVIPKLKFQTGYNNLCICSVLELVNRGHHQIAYVLLNTMHRRNSNLPFAFYFIVQLVKQGMGPDAVIDYCSKITGEDNNGLDRILLKVAEMSLLLQKPDDAIVYFKELHACKFQLRSHFFWPILVCNKGNDPGIYDTLKLMVDMQCPADFDTFLVFTLPILNVKDPQTVITKLQETGYQLKDIVNPLVAHFLRNGDVQGAAQLLKEHPVKCCAQLLFSRWLANAYIKTRDAISTIQILECFHENLTTTFQDNETLGRFIMQLKSTNECDISLVELLLTSFEKKSMKISESLINRILWNMGGGPNNNFVTLLESFEHSKMDNFQSRETVSNWKVDEQKSRGHLFSQFMEYTKNKDLQRVEQLLIKMKKSKFLHSGRTYEALIELFCHHKDLDRAMHYKTLIDEKLPEFQIYLSIIFQLASLLAENEKYEEAENVIRSYHSKFGASDRSFVDAGEAFELLNHFAKSKDVGLARKMFEQVHNFGYCVPSKVVLAPLIKAYIFQNDFNGAAEEYIRIIKTYQMTPWRMGLFKQLIQLEDPEILQKVLDATASVGGNVWAVLDLAQAFVECGQPKQALKIIKASGENVTQSSINSICEKFLKLNKIEELKSLLQVLKDIPGLDIDYLYYQLLKAYGNKGNVEKALEVWSIMQEEDIIPSPRTMSFLATFLQKMNQPVPFPIPQQHSNQGSTTRTGMLSEKHLSSQEASDKLKLTVEDDNLSEAVNLIDEMLSAGIYPNTDVVHRLAFKLHNVGDTKRLTYLEGKLPKYVFKRMPFELYLTKCLSTKGQAEVVLDSLETDIPKYKHNFPLGSLLILLNEKPRLLKRVKDLVDLYYKQGDPEPRKFLWMYLMNNKRFEEADETFLATPEMKSRMLFWSVTKHIKNSNDVEISQKLLDVVKNTNLPDWDKGFVYAAHINVLISLNRIEEALNVFKESQRIIKLEELDKYALNRFKDHLISAGMDVPFTVPDHQETPSGNGYREEST